MRRPWPTGGLLSQIKKSEAKLKEGIFVRPQIIQLFEEKNFNTKLNFTEIRA
jgi:hypothetical protein